MATPCALPMPPPEATPSDDPTSQVLLAMGGLVGREVQLDAFLAALMDRVAAALMADRGTLYLLDPARGELFSRAAHLPELVQIRLKLGQGIAGQVAATGEPLNVPDPVRSEEFFADIDRMTGYRTTSVLAVPLLDASGSVFGVLQVLNRKGAARFGDEASRQLQGIAKQVSTVLQATSLYHELQRAKAQPQAPVGYFFNRIIGESPPMQALYRVLLRAASTEATVLLRGETGCGKELFARALHVNSPRKDRPFVKVDCASLPASLVENELFGHERGAYTGADSRQPGRFEAANGGTIFLDELGELPMEIQGKLLRVLQEREFQRVGGTQTVKVDVRIVAATHRDLQKAVREGRFREDLYYRIRVVELELPPLRERGDEDLERLARHFVAAAAKRHRVSPIPELTGGAIARLKAHSWPGNVRELENCIESAVVLSEGPLTAERLPLPSPDGSTPAPAGPVAASPLRTLAEVEREHILRVLATVDGNRSAAAKVLGIGRNTLARKLEAFGV